MTIPGLISALREEGLIFDATELERVVQECLGESATGRSDTADTTKCPNCPKHTQETQRLQSEKSKLKASLREMTKDYEEVVENYAPVEAQLDKQEKEAGPSRPDDSCPKKLAKSIARTMELTRHIYTLRDERRICDEAIEYLRNENTRLRKENASIREQAQWHEDKYQEGYQTLQLLMGPTSGASGASTAPMPTQLVPSDRARSHTSVTTKAQRDARWAAGLKRCEAKKSKRKTWRVDSKVASQAMGWLASLLRWFLFWFIVLLLIFAVSPGPLNRLWLSYESLP